MWALGCIFAELLALKPIFKGEEVKMDNKKTVPFQRGQMQKIMEIIGTPTRMSFSIVLTQATNGLVYPFTLSIPISHPSSNTPTTLRNGMLRTMDNHSSDLIYSLNYSNMIPINGLPLWMHCIMNTFRRMGE